MIPSCTDLQNYSRTVTEKNEIVEGTAHDLFWHIFGDEKNENLKENYPNVFQVEIHSDGGPNLSMHRDIQCPGHCVL